MKLPTPEKSTICWYLAFTSAGGMPIARQPSTTLRSPVRSSSSAAFTPSSAAWPEVYTAPCSAGSSPAMARSSVDLPDPFLPMTPTTSPWFTTNEIPRMAWTSLMETRRCRFTRRISEVAAVPLLPPAP